MEGHKNKRDDTIGERLKRIETVVQAENAEYGDRDLPEVDPQSLTAEVLAAQLTQWEDRLRRNRSSMSGSSPHPREVPASTEEEAIAVRTTASSGAAEGSTPSLTPDQRKRAVRLIKKLRQESLPRLKK